MAGRKMGAEKQVKNRSVLSENAIFNFSAPIFLPVV
jgi:hypothetical protein